MSSFAPPPQPQQGPGPQYPPGPQHPPAAQYAAAPHYAPQPTVPPGAVPHAAMPPQGYAPNGSWTAPPTGAPKRKRHWKAPTFIGAGTFVLGIMIGTASAGGSDEAPVFVDSANSSASSSDADATDEPAPEDSAKEAAAEEPVEKPDAAAVVGDAVRDGKFEFTVTEVETGVASVGDDFLAQEAQGQYVLVHMTVENIGDEAQLFDGSSQELTDTEGRTHENDGSAAIYLDDSNSFLTDINPGNSVDGVVVFDIPADATPASIELHDSMFSGGVEVALG
ncbi:DUF4352 domain-containing protein [Cellulosimicrobium arenosum]|uniref:DUF4352 domain-containing protein n=1 Tax=Cellulosimicrobium arenosum TaxID=2708133 RepID=A0A927PEP1_9MICO|nr:DUF4352 domain-containing protein [Cellulosimicrobium arenosum]MBD8079951.1 DUF4352 domain-containing protein [Cellulosimicrobium arenosum]